MQPMAALEAAKNQLLSGAPGDEVKQQLAQLSDGTRTLSSLNSALSEVRSSQQRLAHESYYNHIFQDSSATVVNQFLVGYKAQHGTIKEHSDKFVMIRCVSGVNAHASPRLIRLSCGGAPDLARGQRVLVTGSNGCGKLAAQHV